MGVTIRDIARQAGVSVTTASRALNKKGDVSDDARERVLSAARDLNYAVNLHARALAGASSRTLGLIFVDTSVPFFAEMARAVVDTATAHNYSIIVCNTDEDPRRETQAHQMLREKRVDGVLIGSVQSGSAPLRQLTNEGTPFVLLNRYLDDFDADCVYSDNRLGAYEATVHLCRLGHRRIAHLTGVDERYSRRERLLGYRQALEEHGIAIDQRLIWHCDDFALDTVYGFIRRVLANRADVPTALFVYNDRCAIAAIKAIGDMGLRVPQDISVVGYDDLEFARYEAPPLTTVTHAASEIGRIGTEILIRKIQLPAHENWAVQHVVLKPELRIRESSAALAPLSRRYPTAVSPAYSTLPK
jgi:LacI family transcriptional regulator